MKVLKISFLSFVLWSSFAHASGNRVGNGGNVVVCPGKVELLDFYESSRPLEDFSSVDYKKTIEAVIKNLERFNMTMAKQYRQRATEFAKESEFRSDVELVTLPDSKHLFTPAQKECKVQQIAIRKSVAEEESRFVINKDLWSKLSETHKAGLVLHEIIYEHFFRLGEDDSVKARAINAYLFSEAARKDEKEKFWKLIKEFKLPIYL